MSYPIRRILVAVKEPHGRTSPAIRKAAKLARALGAQLELFHAISEPLAVDALMFAGQGVKQMQAVRQARFLKRLEALARPLRRTGIDVRIAAEWDHPAHEALVRRARRSGADLIVAERHESRHVAPWFLRYTDWELLRRSPVPVLLIKTSRPYGSLKVLSAVDPSHAFAKTARLDEEILRMAAGVSAAAKGKLHAVHAYVPTLMDISPAELTAPDAPARIAGHARGVASTGLEKALRAVGLGKLPTAQRHLVAQHPVDAIPQLARQLRCDIVVMGALSRSGIKGLFIGNTAERLLDDLPCDLLIVKPPAFTGRVAAKSRGPLFAVLGPPQGVI